MNNSQLAAARRVANRFPSIVIEVDGNVLTPRLRGSTGDPVTVLDTMTPDAVADALRVSCVVLSNG